MRGGKHEVTVGRQKRQLMMNAELCKDRVDRSYLHPSPSTPIAQFRCVDVILAIRRQQW